MVDQEAAHADILHSVVARLVAEHEEEAHDHEVAKLEDLQFQIIVVLIGAMLENQAKRHYQSIVGKNCPKVEFSKYPLSLLLVVDI